MKDESDESLSDVVFSIEDAKNIFSEIDSNKTQDDNMISICMLKLCDKSICKTLNKIFNSCLTQGVLISE